MGHKEDLGTIQETTMFGPDYKSGAGKPSAAAAASGLKQGSDISSTVWILILIVGLIGIRVLWERAQ
jgi:hypothetical protein